MSLQIQEEDFGMCPSFNSYSTGTILDAARRAGSDFSGGFSFHDFDGSTSPNLAEENNDDDFEFVSLQKPSDCDGLIAPPVFPIFNSDLLVERAEIVEPIRIPLEKLILRDRDDDRTSTSSSSSSSSSSLVDELEGVPSGSYCAWKPKSIGTPNLACKKSRSTGSSSTKRWGIRDLLRRSQSDGKKSYVSFTPSTSSKARVNKSETKQSKEIKKFQSDGKSRGRRSGGGDQKKIFSAHESLYVRNRTSKEEGKRKSYLPYKPDLFGFWTNASVWGKTTPLRSV